MLKSLINNFWLLNFERRLLNSERRLLNFELRLLNFSSRFKVQSSKFKVLLRFSGFQFQKKDVSITYC